MPRFSVNLSTLFTEYKVLERFAHAAEAGFRAVEMQFPYDIPASDLRAACHAAGQDWVLLNAPPGAAGERGLGCLPDRRAAFRDSVLRALDYADALGCRMIHVMAGTMPPDTPRDVLLGTFATNLAWAAEEAAKQGVFLNLEALNPYDGPNYFLRTQDDSAAVVKAVGAANIGLQFDVYHCQRSEGDIAGRLARHMPMINHIQIADAPNRNEPGTGELNWRHIFQTIDTLGYKAWVGCEYRPATDTASSLAWQSTGN
jgi:2-dehydrotetronate isomerase